MSLPFTPHLAYIGPRAGFAFLGSFLTLIGGLSSRLDLRAAVAVSAWPGPRWQAARATGTPKSRNLSFSASTASILRSPSASWPRANSPISAAYVKWVASIACALPSPRFRRWHGRPSYRSKSRRHNIFDFLNRDLKTYVPELSSLRVRAPASRAEARKVAHTAGAPDGRDAAQERAVLEDSGPALDRLHHPARADHFPAGTFQRPPAFRHVHARPARDARQLLALYSRALAA